MNFQHSDIVILMPVYNDWDPLSYLLPRIDKVLLSIGATVRILLVDDASNSPPPEEIMDGQWHSFSQIDVIHLLRNIGHQRAICIGVCHIVENLDCKHIIVMDCDGEDDPLHIPKLINASDESAGTCITFAERRRRTESISFRLFYFIYRFLHIVLVGHRVRFGNFSVVPFHCAKQLAFIPEMWNHYAASVILSKLPYCSVPCSRAPRLTGESKMNFVSLVIHGLSALAVFSDRIGARVLMASIHLMFLTVFGMAMVVVIRLTADLSIPGWATFSFGILLLFLGQMATISASICLIVLSQRNNFGFLPIKIYKQFVGSIKTIWRLDKMTSGTETQQVP